MIEVVIGAADGTTALWVDVSAPTSEDLDTVARDYGIPRAALEECMAPMHLPKHERLGDTTFVIMRAHDEEAGSEVAEYLGLTRKVSLFLGDRFLVSVHRRPMPFLEVVKSSVRAASAPVYLQVVMLEILLAGVETYYAPLEEAEHRIQRLEAELLAADASSVDWRAVFRTKVRIQTIRRLFWHVQNATEKYVPRSSINQPLAQDLRERTASLSFLAESLDADLDNLLGVQLSLAANRTNDVVRVLTIFSVFFLPLTFIVGVYGMNFAHMPELQLQWGYPAVWCALAVTALAIGAWFHRRGWLRFR